VSEITSGTALAGYLTTYPQQVVFGAADPAEVFDRYHTPDFVMVNDGLTLDRERLLGHVRPARHNATAIDVYVDEAFVDGTRVAARYTLTARMRHSGVVATEIHMFGQLAPDGRLRRVEQLTRTLPATDPAAS